MLSQYSEVTTQDQTAEMEYISAHGASIEAAMSDAVNASKRRVAIPAHGSAGRNSGSHCNRHGHVAEAWR